MILPGIFEERAITRWFRPELQTVVHYDSSAFAIGGWIDQIDEEGHEHPVLYWSRKTQDRETRYNVYEQELLALVEMLRIVRPYIDGRPFVAKTDHRALQWLQTQTRLSKQKAGWIKRLQELNMTIKYAPQKNQPGCRHPVAAAQLRAKLSEMPSQDPRLRA
ncbi:MAG: hypothetical protein BJ554DRAFT_6224 [Olpidium bornovanus]|uniref:Reverse transcriptase RNase H-like domain-containing protein n=1 Tax=Olpidium bornovanus TaxID=278681 RepID=A0A8H7ZY43_9FUNG|nr:MAG: hypothetical protein BJ554DRAFT_6224 [Olpidium bornovanus]